MEFNPEKPIYLQICDTLCERILSGAFAEGDRIPSVREYGAELGVNPNTMMRSYEKLTADGIIFNKRGIGYFVSPGARAAILAEQRRSFIEKEVPAIRRRLELLGLGPEVFSKP